MGIDPGKRKLKDGLVRPKISREHELENKLVMIGSQLKWIEAVLDDQEVSDFAMSFSVVRRVWELKQNEIKIEDPAETARKSAEASLTKWKAEQEVEDERP